jgi:DNA (cytosine-5)-methyltransferase 1
MSFRPSSTRESRSSRKPRVAEFFAGIGLVRLALERRGFEVVFANDIDPDKLEIYESNFGAEHFKLGDIHELRPSDVPEAEVYTASFPCNDLSIAGGMAGLSGKESSAFWGLIRILKAKRRQGALPELVMLENVPGFLMSKQGADFKIALKTLNGLGYSVDAVMIDAARFVPQSRLRLFVIAKLDAPERLPFLVEPSSIRNQALLDFMRANPDIRWSVSEVPSIPPSQLKLHDIVEPLTDGDPAWWSEERTAYFMNQLSERHARTANEMIERSSVSFATAFRRVRNGRSMAELRTDGIAGCLRTPRGGSGRQILFKAGKGRRQVRLLTARECARLQGVPDTFRVDVPLNQALFGFGDAVCVPVVDWIAATCLRPALEDIKARRRGRVRVLTA